MIEQTCVKTSNTETNIKIIWFDTEVSNSNEYLVNT